MHRNQRLHCTNQTTRKQTNTAVSIFCVVGIFQHFHSFVFQSDFPLNSFKKNRDCLSGLFIRRDFAKQCQISEKPSFIQTESTDSTMSIEEHLLPPSIGMIGDDFMRTFISFELYGSDFTDENGEFSAITEAYLLVPIES